jgi:uncharacterized protein (DUF58 family)
LAATALLLVVGWYKGINLILLLAYTMVALVILNALGARRGLRQVTGQRNEPGLVFAGEPASPAAVEVIHDGPRPLVGWWVAEPTEIRAEVSGPPGPTHVWPVGRLDPHQPLRVTHERVFNHRGRYRLGGVTIGSGFPFGLIHWSRPLTTDTEFVVLPRLGRIQASRLQQWLLRATREDGRAKPIPQRQPQREDTIHGLRPYRTGDSPKLIHWRTSARCNELMVREFETPVPRHELLLVVEPCPNVGPAVEAAVSLAATVAWEWCRQPRNRLSLVLVTHPTGTIEVPPGTGTDHGRRVLEVLADVTGQERVDAARIAAAAAVVPGTSGIPVLLISARRNSPLIEALTVRLGRRPAVIDVSSPPDFYTPPDRTPAGYNTAAGTSASPPSRGP